MARTDWTRRWLATAVAVLGSLAVATSAAAAPTPSATASIVKGGDFARDCLFQPALDGDHRDRIRFVLWCSVDSGGVRFRVRRTDRTPITGFSRVAAATGAGAIGPFRCRQVGETVRCAGHKHGPVVVRGWIEVPAGSRCDRLYAPAANLIFGGSPLGCPHTRRARANFSLGYMRSFRHELGFDADLGGDRAAIDRRIHGIVRAWERGEPVARVTAMEFGQPLRPVDERRFELREAILERVATALERWVPRHAAATYAGYTVDDQVIGGPIFYVGFTGDQAAQLAQFKRQVKLIAPGRIQEFPIPPHYSEAELSGFAERIWRPLHSPLSRLVTDTVIVTEANKLQVGTEHVRLVKELLERRFGTLDPFEVVHEGRGVLL
jgi:hypothetical protein